MELGGGVRGENPDLLLAVAYERETGAPLGFLRLVPCVRRATPAGRST